MNIDMKLYELLSQVKFDDVFSDIIRHESEAKNQRAWFLSAFETLCSVTPAKETETVIEVHEQEYLGEGIHDIWINASNTADSNLWENLLAGRIKLVSTSNRPDAYCKITNDRIVADLLWQLVAYGFPEEATALTGYLLNNRRSPDSSQLERIDEICSYIDLHLVSGLSHQDIYQYRDVGNIAWLVNITPYSLPRDKAAYDMICFLDDFMWFNNEIKSILIISASEGYDNEVSKIEDFSNNMLKMPTILHGIPLLPGIEVMAIFITE